MISLNMVAQKEDAFTEKLKRALKQYTETIAVDPLETVGSLQIETVRLAADVPCELCVLRLNPTATDTTKPACMCS